jgi:hypothetical protein
MDTLETMAHDFYGYGRWSAPYWFIGMEPAGDNNLLRAQAFSKLQSDDGVCDCKEFHEAIGVYDWHRTNPKPALQRTWRRLIMLLASYLGADTGKESLRMYQRDHWGMKRGYTCVIDLCGLSSPKLKFEDVRSERIKKIRDKISENSPQLVVMYGLKGKGYFQEIAGCELISGEVVKKDNTLFILDRQPARDPRHDTVWKDLGTLARANFGKTASRNDFFEQLHQGFLGPITLPDGARVFNGALLGLAAPLVPRHIGKDLA